MSLNVNILNILLIATVVFVPVLYLLSRRLQKWKLSETVESIIRYWLYFLIYIVVLRAAVGIWFLLSNSELYGIAKFYPIRIAYPNYEILWGIPFVILCVGILVKLPQIANYIENHSKKYLLVWLFSSFVLLSFGAIHGGPITGNIGISNSVEHIFDTEITQSVAETFATHTDRIKGDIEPGYQAPHSMSHPAAAVAYWQVLRNNTNAFIFSAINVLLFALAFPLIYWALKRRIDETSAMQITLACLLIPSFLIYGRSDDAVYYAMAAAMMLFTYIAVQEKKYHFAIAAGFALAIGINYSYAALIMLPAMFAFNTDIRFFQLWEYIKKIIPHVIIIILVLIASISFITATTGFNLTDGFRASVDHNKSSNIVALLEAGRYARVINDRVMASSDFLLFGGPLFLYMFVRWIQNRSWDIKNWKIKNIALTVLLMTLVINSNGPGEVSRPWGALFMLVAICWFTEFFQKESSENRWALIRVQFAWALILQTPLHFVW